MSEAFLGEIRMVGFNFAPRGWALANGTVMAISQNTALFSLLSDTYGGDGVATFALPDLRSRSPVGMGQGPGLSDLGLGQQDGRENVTLTRGQIPSVTAQVAIPVNKATPSDPLNKGFSQYPSASTVLSPTLDPEVGAVVLLYGPPQAGETTTLSPFEISTSAGSNPVWVRNPCLGINFIVCVDGLYPSRP